MSEEKSEKLEKVGNFVSSTFNKIINLIIFLIIIGLIIVIGWFWHESQMDKQEMESLKKENIELREELKDGEDEDLEVEKVDDSKNVGDVENEKNVIVKTSQELMKEFIIKKYRINANSGDFAMDKNLSDYEIIRDYKIYKEVKSPYSGKIAVLYGTGSDENIEYRECNSKPTGIFINDNGTLEEETSISGSCHASLGTDIKWKDDNTVLFDQIITTEGGVNSTQKILIVK